MINVLYSFERGSELEYKKFSFVLIAIIRYFTLSSKQIMSILRKFLSSSSYLIVNLDLKSNFTMKVRGFFTGH